MAAKKKKGSRKGRPRYVYVRRRIDRTPEERRWLLWNHDLDTILHELVKNPALVGLSPKEILRRAEVFADEYRALQERRRPPGIRPGFPV